MEECPQFSYYTIGILSIIISLSQDANIQRSKGETLVSSCDPRRVVQMDQTGVSERAKAKKLFRKDEFVKRLNSDHDISELFTVMLCRPNLAHQDRMTQAFT